MLKVHILTQCSNCDGQAYLPAGEAEKHKGEKYTRYQPCPVCEGSGYESKWVSLEEFAVLLRQAQCSHEHSTLQGGFRFRAGEVWDDITEICTDCGANLDKLAKQTIP